MREPTPSGHRPVDLLIAAFAVLANIVVAAALAVWDFIQRTLPRLDP